MSQYETALNIVLGTTLCFLVYKLATSKKAAPLKPYVAKKVVLTEFTPTMLQLHNGVGDALTYLAVKGNVYNVSAGAAFYGPAMPYAAFAGRDASRGLAKNSFDPTMVRQIDEEIDTLDDLSAEEQAALDEWSNFFASKYIHVGTLVAQNREQ